MKNENGNLSLQSEVYDLNCDELPFPCSFQVYAEQCLKYKQALQPKYTRKYRILSSTDFLATFSSDRSHMITNTGSYSSPLPSWPAITLPNIKNNLFSEFLNLSFKPDQVYSEAQLLSKFLPLN